MEFRIDYVGEGAGSDGWARNHDLARTEMLDLSLNLYWSQVVFTSPAVTFDVHAYALGYLSNIAYAFESLPTKKSIELNMDDSGDALNFARRGSWVSVGHETGSVEVPFDELSATFRRCSHESFGKIYARYPTLSKNPSVRHLERRLERLPTAL